MERGVYLPGRNFIWRWERGFAWSNCHLKEWCCPLEFLWCVENFCRIFIWVNVFLTWFWKLWGIGRIGIWKSCLEDGKIFIEVIEFSFGWVNFQFAILSCHLVVVWKNLGLGDWIFIWVSESSICHYELSFGGCVKIFIWVSEFSFGWVNFQKR